MHAIGFLQFVLAKFNLKSCLPCFVQNLLMGWPKLSWILRVSQLQPRQMATKRVSILIKKIDVTCGTSSHSSCCNVIGESAPPERQVSPEKLYRAALLRNRFADTILKAREKALEKVGLS